MSTGTSVDQPTVPREWRYSPGWRRFTEIILRPGAAAADQAPVAGPGKLSEDGRGDPGAQPPVLRRLAHGRPVQRRLRAPVPGVHDQVGHLRGEGDRAADVQAGQLPVYRGRGDAGLVLKQAERALAAGACVIVYPEGTATRDPDLWPMVAKTGVARLGAEHRRAGHPGRALGGAGHPALRVEEAPALAAQDGPDGRRAGGGPVRLRGPAAGRQHAAGRHGRHHGRHHRAAGPDPGTSRPPVGISGARAAAPGSPGPAGRPAREPGPA